MTMLSGKLKPFTGQGKLFHWMVWRDDGTKYEALMTVQDATHAARCGASIALIKKRNSNG